MYPRFVGDARSRRERSGIKGWAKWLALDAAYSIERLFSMQIFDTKDAKEGPKAFMEGRKPEWTGK